MTGIPASATDMTSADAYGYGPRARAASLSGRPVPSPLDAARRDEPAKWGPEHGLSEDRYLVVTCNPAPSDDLADALLDAAMGALFSPYGSNPGRVQHALWLGNRLFLPSLSPAEDYPRLAEAWRDSCGDALRAEGVSWGYAKRAKQCTDGLWREGAL